LALLTVNSRTDRSPVNVPGDMNAIGLRDRISVSNAPTPLNIYGPVYIIIIIIIMFVYWTLSNATNTEQFHNIIA